MHFPINDMEASHVEVNGELHKCTYIYIIHIILIIIYIHHIHIYIYNIAMSFGFYPLSVQIGHP